MKPPHKTKSFYQVITYLGFSYEEINYFISFNSYNKAKAYFNEEVKKAMKEYLVELLSIVEVQRTKDESKTWSRKLVLGNNL